MSEYVYIYVDRETGAMGNRSDLVISAVLSDRLHELGDMTPAQRKAAVSGDVRYFGDVSDARYVPTMADIRRTVITCSHCGHSDGTHGDGCLNA